MALSSKVTLFDYSVKAYLRSLHFSFASWHPGFVSRGRWGATAEGSSMSSLGHFTAPLLLCRVLSHTPWPVSPSIPTYLQTVRHLSMNSFVQHPRGQISSKSHQHSSTATSLPFSEPWRRQSVVLTGMDPYSGYEFALPACKSSAIHGLAEGLILTALRLIKELTPQQKENSNGIMPMGSTGLTAYIITQK